MAEQRTSNPQVCECGKALVIIGDSVWCSGTLAKYRALYGEPVAHQVSHREQQDKLKQWPKDYDLPG